MKAPRVKQESFEPSGLIEYEPVSFASARAVANRLPTGIELMLDKIPGYWHKIRRPTSKRDLVLTPSTIEWMRRLPKDIWPLQTGAMFPRIVNQMALSWRDREEREAQFDELLNSPRKTRRGFPDAVDKELRQLYAYSLTQSP